MEKYRMRPTYGGFEGYWVVQERKWYGWKTLFKFSVWSCGYELAKRKAAQAFSDLTTLPAKARGDSNA